MIRYEECLKLSCWWDQGSFLPADGCPGAERAGELGTEDAANSPVSLLQRNVTLYKTLEPRAGLSSLRHVTD